MIFLMLYISVVLSFLQSFPSENADKNKSIMFHKVISQTISGGVTFIRMPSIDKMLHGYSAFYNIELLLNSETLLYSQYNYSLFNRDNGYAKEVMANPAHITNFHVIDNFSSREEIWEQYSITSFEEPGIYIDTTFTNSRGAIDVEDTALVYGITPSNNMKIFFHDFSINLSIINIAYLEIFASLTVDRIYMSIKNNFFKEPLANAPLATDGIKVKTFGSLQSLSRSLGCMGITATYTVKGNNFYMKTLLFLSVPVVSVGEAHGIVMMYAWSTETLSQVPTMVYSDEVNIDDDRHTLKFHVKKKFEILRSIILLFKESATIKVTRSLSFMVEPFVKCMFASEQKSQRANHKNYEDRLFSFFDNTVHFGLLISLNIDMGI